MRTPEFWYPANGRPSSILPWLLAPFAFGYSVAGWLRLRFAQPYHAAVPVICAGNLTAGGTGKTPLALALAARLAARGVKPHFLTRGYGGSLKGPVLVAPDRHSAAEVGDEALLLAAMAPTWVARNRKAGAQAAMAAGAQVIILDDGHQNPHLHKDLSLLLICAERGFGNGRVIPAGPLREPVQRGFARAGAIVMIGEGAHAPATAKPLLRAQRILRGPEQIRGKNIFAFCGIGAPQQFFDMLSNAGAALTGAHAFPDHHPYTDEEFNAIIAAAAQSDAMPLTTEKDWVRLSPSQRQQVCAIAMDISFCDEAALAQLLDHVMQSRS